MKVLFPALVVLFFALLVPVRADSPATASSPAIATQNEKLKTIRLSLNFYNATLEEAVMFLRVESKRLDPAHQEFNFVISPDATAAAKPVTLVLNGVSYEQALQAVCELAGVKYVVEAGAVRILALSENAPDAVTGLAAVAPHDKATMETQRKLASIIADRVNFEKLDIAVAVQFLAQKSKELDPAHVGINFLLVPIRDGDHVRREITLKLDNVPLLDVIQYIIQQTDMSYQVKGDIVIFKPLEEELRARSGGK